MKKLYLTLVMALLFGCHWAQAQETLIACNSSVQPNQNVPIYGWMADLVQATSQYIIPATELTSMQGGTITNLTYHTGKETHKFGGEWTVYIKEVGEQTTLSSYVDWNTLTSVYTGSFTISSYWMTFKLDTPFKYTGGNLLIGFKQNSKAEYAQTYWYGITTSYNSSINYGTSYQFIPTTQFTYTAAPSVPACHAQNLATTDDVTTSHAVVTWESTGSSWEVRYKKGNGSYTSLGTVNTKSYTLTGLNANTEYTIEVRTIGCDPEQTEWASCTFTTEAVAAGGGSGETTTLLNEGFEGNTMPPANWIYYGDYGGWTLGSADPSSHLGTIYMRNNNYFGPYELVSPQITIPANSTEAKLSFFSYIQFGEYYGGNCRVMLSTTTNARDQFNTTIWTSTNTGASWNEQIVDLIAYKGQSIYLNFVYQTNDNHQWCVDDIKVTVTEAAGPSTNTFTTAGAWNVASNWSDNQIPTIDDDVVIAAAATIPAGCVAAAKSVVLDQNGSITIANGGQLMHNSADLAVTMEKSINTNGGQGTFDNYYFLATPIIGGTASTAMPSGDYDLYSFAQDQDEEEWQNLRGTQFVLNQNQGYLYANTDGNDITFNGTVNKSDAAVNVAVSYVAEHPFSGFNLVGNPFTCNASVTGAGSYYQLNTEKDGEVIINANPVVAPCTGIFAVVDENTNVTFTRSNSTANVTRGSQSLFNVELRHNNKLVDRAYLSVNDCNSVKKLNLRANSTKIFFMDGNKKVAKVAANGLSTMPLYFEAENNGTYTISINTENLSCGYLHLIDNLTGADVDMLVNNSYSFQTNVNDYSCRFKLVFGATGIEEGAENSNFVIVDGKRLVITDVEGQVDVIDMMGRTISSQTVNGSFDQTLEVSAGVYFVRANGMVQKVVLK